MLGSGRRAWSAGRCFARDGGSWRVSLRGSGFGVGEIPDLPRFTGWASKAGFQVVQLLPVGAVCGGETSPYAAASAFALDPVYLGLDA